jgi:hypothetical protein
VFKALPLLIKQPGCQTGAVLALVGKFALKGGGGPGTACGSSSAIVSFRAVSICKDRVE